MQLQDNLAIITGGASGLGAATAKAFAAGGCKVALFDLNEEAGNALASELGGLYQQVDVTSEEQVKAGIEAVEAWAGKPARIVVNCAGIAIGQKTVGRGQAHALADFQRVININLIGTFNVLRLAAERMVAADALECGDKGLIINTASVAAFDGQIGQVAYTASKAAIAGMTLPIARDLHRDHIRINTIAPGTFMTPMMAAMPDNVKEGLAAAVPHPSRLGDPAEYAQLAKHMVENQYLNGETIRLDGAIRMGLR